jgi:hypothetical protein
MVRFNTDTDQQEEYNGTAWISAVTTGKAIAMALVFG